MTKTLRAAEALGARSIVVGGGVAANSVLRARIEGDAAAIGMPVVVPRPGLCTDNGAMIGAAGARRLAAGQLAGLDLDARPRCPSPSDERRAADRPGRRPADAARGGSPGTALAQPELPRGRRRPRSDPGRGGPSPGRAVLEIGPGLGILTGGLLEAGAAVTAVELDRGLAACLRDRFARIGLDDAARMRARRGRCARPAPRGWLPPYDVVANLPYHITSPTLHRLLGEPPARSGWC